MKVRWRMGGYREMEERGVVLRPRMKVRRFKDRWRVEKEKSTGKVSAVGLPDSTLQLKQMQMDVKVRKEGIYSVNL